MAQTWLTEYRQYAGIVLQPDVYQWGADWSYMIHIFEKEGGKLGPRENHATVMGTWYETEEEATLACSEAVRKALLKGGKVW